jgi:hypothetical protein
MQTIKLNNTEHPFVFKLIAIEAFELETGKKIEDALSTITMTDITTLAHAGLKEGAMRAGNEFDLTRNDLAIAIGDDPTLFNDITRLIEHDMEQFTKALSAKKKIVKKK